MQHIWMYVWFSANNYKSFSLFLTQSFSMASDDLNV